MYVLLHPDLARATVADRTRHSRIPETARADKRRHLVERERVRASLLVRPQARPGEQR